MLVRDRSNDHWQSYGSDAELVLPQASKHLELVRPYRDSVIADYQATAALLKHYVAGGSRRFLVRKPNALVTVSGLANSSEKRALIDAATAAGLNKVSLIPAVYAAALGAGANISAPKGAMIIHAGAGSTEIAMFSSGFVVASQRLRLGGIGLSEALEQRVRRESGVRFSPVDIERLKHSYIDIGPKAKKKPISLKGEQVGSGKPKRISIENELLCRALEPSLDRIVRAARKVIEASPPELVSDVMEHGALLTGGSAQLEGLSALLSSRLKLACSVAEEPLLCPVRGASLALTHVADFSRTSSGEDAGFQLEHRQ